MTLRAIVTRPAAQAVPWVTALRAAGIDAVALPLIAIGPPADTSPAREVWARLSERALVFFVSPNAVAHFFAARPVSATWPAGTLAAAPGPGTGDAIRAAGVPAAQVVEPAPDAASFDSETLWLRLRDRNWRGRDVLVVRGEEGRDWLAEQLRAAGARADYLAVYRRLPPQPDAAQRRLLDEAAADPGRHLWLFSSSEAVRHLQALWPNGTPRGARALASHPRIAETTRAAGFDHVDEVAATPDAVIAAVRARAAGDDMGPR